MKAIIYDSERNKLGTAELGDGEVVFEGFTDPNVARRLKEIYGEDHETKDGGRDGKLHFTEEVTYKVGTEEHFQAVTTELHFLKWKERPGFFLIGEVIEE
jgi:hypothetical protein